MRSFSGQDRDTVQRPLFCEGSGLFHASFNRIAAFAWNSGLAEAAPVPRLVQCGGFVQPCAANTVHLSLLKADSIYRATFYAGTAPDAIGVYIRIRACIRRYLFADDAGKKASGHPLFHYQPLKGKRFPIRRHRRHAVLTSCFQRSLWKQCRIPPIRCLG